MLETTNSGSAAIKARRGNGVGVTGEPWEYENWGDGEPNNSSNVVAGESCVAMWPEKWNDLANSNVYEQSGYICEWEASDVAEETQVEGYTGHLYEFYTLPESEWSPAQSHGSKQRDAASGKAVIWRSLNRQRKIFFSTVQ